MYSEITVIYGKFKRLWKYYIFQSLLAATAMLIIMVAIGKDKMVLIGAMASTAFVIFTMPGTASAKTRIVIGSHLVGLVSGAIFYCINIPLPLECALAVGTAIFLMVALDVEHPPAAGTALAVAVRQVSPYDAFIIIATALLLCLFARLLRPYMKNLV